MSIDRGPRRDRAALAKVRLGRQIANALRREILEGELKPGQHLMQQEICEQFGTSRMPARDALMLLTYEGFLTEDNFGHLIVAEFGRRDLEDAYLIEARLRGLACRLVAESRTTGQLDELRATHEEFKRAAEAGNGDAIVDISWSFHRKIDRMAGSPRLLAALSASTSHVARGRLAALPEWAAKIVQMQQEVLSAIEGKEATRAENAMAQHVAEAGRYFIDYLGQRGVLAATAPHGTDVVGSD